MGRWRSEKQEAQEEQKHFRYFVVNLNNKSSYYAVVVIKDRVFRLTIITLNFVGICILQDKTQRSDDS